MTWAYLIVVSTLRRPGSPSGCPLSNPRDSPSRASSSRNFDQFGERISDLRASIFSPFSAPNSVSSEFMVGKLIRMEAHAAIEDLRIRTLGPIGYDFGRLLYLASMRDYSTGEYEHHGLASSFSEVAAREALAVCHEELFSRLAVCPLNLFVPQVERFMRSACHDLQKTVDLWETLEVYHLTVPCSCDPLTAALFVSNVKIAMALLKSPRSAQLG